MKPLLSKNPLVRWGKALFYYVVAVPILFLLVKIFLGLRVRGRRNVRKLRKKGFVMVCSHNHTLDCVAQGMLLFPRRAVYTSMEPIFSWPVIGPLVRLMNSVPVPSNPLRMKRFLEEISGAVQAGRILMMYPEGELKPYCRELRPFHDGAFMVAAMADAPVLPVAVTFRKRRGLWRLLKRRPLLTVTAGEPIYSHCAAASAGGSRREARRLCDAARSSIQAMMDDQRPLDEVPVLLTKPVTETKKTA